MAARAAPERDGDRARPLKRRRDELLRRVGAAAARPESVDRERDRRGEVARVAGATASARDDRAAEAARGAARAAGAVAASESIAGQTPLNHGSSVDAADLRGTAASTR